MSRSEDNDEVEYYLGVIGKLVAKLRIERDYCDLLREALKYYVEPRVNADPNVARRALDGESPKKGD